MQTVIQYQRYWWHRTKQAKRTFTQIYCQSDCRDQIINKKHIEKIDASIIHDVHVQINGDEYDLVSYRLAFFLSFILDFCLAPKIAFDHRQYWLTYHRKMNLCQDQKVMIVYNPLSFCIFLLHLCLHTCNSTLVCSHPIAFYFVHT